jgi:hypothetical protein
MIRDDILYPGFDQTVAIDNLDNKFAVHTKVGPWSILSGRNLSALKCENQRPSLAPRQIF